jgi:hypothetical protein
MDAVHLHDIFVTFPPGAEHIGPAKITSLAGMFRSNRCSSNRLRSKIVSMEIRRDA